MIIFVYGKDTYRATDYVQQLTKKFRADRDPQGMNIFRMNVLEEKAQDIWNTVLSAPFLAEKRMVILENILTTPNKEDFRAELKKKIEEQQIPDSTVLILFESTDTFKKKEQKELFAVLAVQKFTQKFDLLEGRALAAWIAAEVQSMDAQIEAQAAQILAIRASGDQWKIKNTIQQLIAYCKGRVITAQDIDVFIAPLVDDNIFHLVDAIVAARPQHVFEMLEEQYRQGKDAIYIFAMLLRQFRILLALKEAENRGVSTTTVAKSLNLHTFVVKKSLPLVQKYTLKQLRNIYEQLLQIDTQIKTGGADAGVLIDVFVGQNLQLIDKR